MSHEMTLLNRCDSADWAYIMSDDSMIGARICPGDMILVKQQFIADNGDIVLVLYNGEVRIGRYSRHKDCDALTPANDKYQTILSRFDCPSFEIIGIAIAFIGTLAYAGREAVA